MIDLLHGCGLIGAHIVDTPMEQHLKLNDKDGALLEDSSLYRRLVGRLIYHTIIRPNIAFMVNILSQFRHQLHKPHLDVAHRLLQCLKKTLGQSILLPSNSFYILQFIVLLIGQVVPWHNSLLLDFVSLLALVSYHGEVRNNQLSLISQRKLNIMPLLWQLKKLYGLTRYFKILTLSLQPTICYIVITRLLVKLLKIQSFTNTQNILKSIVTLFVKILKRKWQLKLHLISLMIKSLISLQKP